MGRSHAKVQARQARSNCLRETLHLICSKPQHGRDERDYAAAGGHRPKCAQRSVASQPRHAFPPGIANARTTDSARATRKEGVAEETRKYGHV